MAEKSCPSCGRDDEMPRVSEKNETPDGLPKKLEWLIGQARFQINKRGASYTAPTKNPLATQSKNIGHLLTLYGIAKDRPGITTVGLTASSQPNRTEKGWTVNWKDVRQIQLNPEERVVMLKEKWFTGGLGGGLGNFRIYCTPENYETVAATCQAFYSRTQPRTGRRSPNFSTRSESETASPPPPPPPPTSTCPTCGSQLSYIQQYQRWYCHKEQKYV